LTALTLITFKIIFTVIVLYWFQTTVGRSVGDRDVYPGSRILNFTHPGSRISDPRSRISVPDPKTATKERGEKKF
jgi:hypothetical protein